MGSSLPINSSRTVYAANLKKDWRVKLVKPLGKEGGEGALWATDDNNIVAKIYFDNRRPSDWSKFKRMMERPFQIPSELKNEIGAAWPLAVFSTEKSPWRRPIGILLERVNEPKSLVNLYIARERKKEAELVDWCGLHVVSMRLAQVAEQAHKQGFVIGDLNSKNFLVDYQSAKVSVIDTDSFQIPKADGTFFRCTVGMPDFIPPELIGTDFRKIIRKPNQDNFALAVNIYQLLFGYHPFSGGIWKRVGQPPSMEDRIRMGHSHLARNTGFDRAPLQHPVDILHPELISLFRRAFLDGHTKPDSRPTAKEWSEGLMIALGCQMICKKNDQHIYTATRSSCYWCSIKSNLFPPNKQRRRRPKQLIYGAVAIEQALKSGNDENAIARWEKAPHIHNGPLGKKLVAEINKAKQRVKAFVDWESFTRTNPTTPWLWLNAWPVELDKSKYASVKKFNDQPLNEFVLQLAEAKKLLDAITSKLDVWASERDYTEKELLSNWLKKEVENAIAYTLPSDFPERGGLVRRLKDVEAWLTDYEKVAVQLDEAKDIDANGQTTEAIEILESILKKWPGHKKVIEIHRRIEPLKAPWDSKELRDEILAHISGKRYLAAKAKLALLPRNALTAERQVVEQALNSSSNSLSDALEFSKRREFDSAKRSLVTAKQQCPDLHFADTLLVLTNAIESAKPLPSARPEPVKRKSTQSPSRKVVDKLDRRRAEASNLNSANPLSTTPKRLSAKISSENADSENVAPESSVSERAIPASTISKSSTPNSVAPLAPSPLQNTPAQQNGSSSLHSQPREREKQNSKTKPPVQPVIPQQPLPTPSQIQKPTRPSSMDNDKSWLTPVIILATLVVSITLVVLALLLLW